MSETTDRRGFLNKTMFGAAGLGIAGGLPVRAEAAASEALVESPAPKPPAKTMPQGKIGKVSMSRLLMGGNLIGGWPHGRDLIYLGGLFKAYNTEKKVFDTLELAEQQGINTIQIDPLCFDVLEKYRKERKSKLQIMLCFNPAGSAQQVRDMVKRFVDRGATLLYIHGEAADHLARAGKIDVLAKAMEAVKAAGVPAGVGGHSLETPMACEKAKVPAEFYVKTFHMDRYWSATPKDRREEWCWYMPQSADHDGFHDNIWCLDAEKTAAFFETVEKPWVAFKVMAAGAIDPAMAFSHAFRNGADFIIAGMFDFQVEDDVKIASDTLRKLTTRKRPWRG
jgi:hypothetical protein